VHLPPRNTHIPNIYFIAVFISFLLDQTTVHTSRTKTESTAEPWETVHFYMSPGTHFGDTLRLVVGGYAYHKSRTTTKCLWII